MPNSPINEGTATGAGSATTPGNLLASGVTGQPVGIKAMLQEQAGYIVGPGFDEDWSSAITGAEGRVNAGTIGLTQSPLTTGRTGGGKILYTQAGAGGTAPFRQSTPFNLGGPTSLICTGVADPWTVTGRFAIQTVDPTCEMALASIATSPFFAATDGASGFYVYVGVNGPADITQLSVKSWNGLVAKNFLTGIALDIGPEAWHSFTLASWSGTLYVLYDGVVRFSIPWDTVFDTFAGLLTNAETMYGFRSTTAGSESAKFDFIYSAVEP